MRLDMASLWRVNRRTTIFHWLRASTVNSAFRAERRLAVGQPVLRLELDGGGGTGGACPPQRLPGTGALGRSQSIRILGSR